MSAPVGSLAAEAALLLDAIAERLESLRPEGTGAGTRQESPRAAATGAPAPGPAAPPAEAGAVCPHCGHDPSAAVACAACPLCRLLAVLRGERPETTARLVEGALVVVQSLRALLAEPESGSEPAEARSTESPSAGSARESPPAAAPGPPAGGLERIIVR